MRKTKDHDWKGYPARDGYRSGCKVAWHYYRDRATAEEASKAAIHNGVIKAGQGFDFGYNAPGSTRYLDPVKYAQSEYVGMYEVCIP